MMEIAALQPHKYPIKFYDGRILNLQVEYTAMASPRLNQNEREQKKKGERIDEGILMI